MSEDILTRLEGHAGIISLNRPAALHALTLDMVHAVTGALLKWRHNDAVKLVINDHSEGRGFCAGGGAWPLLSRSVPATGLGIRS